MATKDYSNKQEKEVARFLDWQVVSGSGAAACVPGDIISGEWLGECKTHVKPDQRITFKKDVWNKLCEEAIMKRRKPVLIVDDGSQKLSKTWCMFRRQDVTESFYTKEIGSIGLGTTVKTNVCFTHKYLSPLIEAMRTDANSDYVAYIAQDFDKNVLIAPLTMFHDFI